MEQRYLRMSEVATRSTEGGELEIEGYFVVFDDVYQVWDGATESIAPGAFTDSIGGDVRALYNHNPDIVLGRTGAGTLELREDNKGLWGKVKINSNDTQAVDVYERIARGDVSGCSFGFDIEEQKETLNDDGTIHWTILKVNPLYEVSPTAFPAYEATHIEARKRDIETINKRKNEVWKNKMKERIKNGTKSANASQED